MRSPPKWRADSMPEKPYAYKVSRDFLATSGLLTREGNTFGPEFEKMYTGHKNYYYYMNRNAVVPGAEKAAFIFEELDEYTRQACKLQLVCLQRAACGV